VWLGACLLLPVASGCGSVGGGDPGRAATSAATGGGSAARDRILIIAGDGSHGYGEHEYRAGARVIEDALEAAQSRFAVDVLEGWPEDPDVFARAAGILLTMDGRGGHLALPHLDELDALMAEGVGLMALHWALHVPRGAAGDAFRRWIGGVYETDFSTNPKWDARLRLDPAHPIARGVPPATVHDEWYFNIRFREGMEGVRPVATAVPSDDDRSRVSAFLPWAHPPEVVRDASGRRETLVWAVEREDGGRGVGFTGGHYHWNLGGDAYRRLLLNAVLWMAGGEVPEGGVPSRTPTFAALRRGQDEREPRGRRRSMDLSADDLSADDLSAGGGPAPIRPRRRSTERGTAGGRRTSSGR